MTGARYCESCAALLPPQAVICGECGTRYAQSPYERHGTRTPGAWAQPRRAAQGAAPAPEPPEREDTGIQLLGKDGAHLRAPDSTTLRPAGQYDRAMDEYGNQSMNASEQNVGAPSAPSATSPGVAGGTLEAPMDGCVPATPLKRILAALLDGVIVNVLLIPLYVAITLIALAGHTSGLSSILLGVGVILPVAYTIVMLWLHGAKGFTLGKLILGLRTARLSTSRPIGFLRALGRAVIYGVVPVIMALSVFLDPKKLLRGFHDRAIDSVVVDVKQGRHPFEDRPDAFDRPGMDHYMPESSVAVTAHENLMTAPGSAWGDAPSSSASSAQTAPSSWDPAPSQPPSGQQGVQGWGSEPGAGTQSSAAEAPVDSWAPPPPSDGFGAQPSAPQQAAATPYGSPQPEAPQAAPSPYGAPAPSPYSAPEQSAPAPAPDQSAVPAPWGHPSAPGQQSVPVAEETTGGNWEETQRAGAVPAMEEDLEQTRMSAVAPKSPSIRIVVDGGAEITVSTPVVLGRNPSASGGEETFVVKDDTRSLSKTHLRVDGTGEDIVVTDLGSTNGSAIIREDGAREPLVPDTATVLPSGAQVAVGDRVLSLERVQ